MVAMARILVTGSAQGIGAHTARTLVGLGHDVTVHGRSPARADAARAYSAGASAALVGAFDDLAATREFANAATAAGPWDVIVHNAAVGYRAAGPLLTGDGLEQTFHVNAVSPYVLTCLMPLAPRMVYIGSDAHRQGELRLDDLAWTERCWDQTDPPGFGAYNDSKLYLQMVVFELAERFPESAINVVHPGWVKTAMGGPGAQISLDEGADTPVWMATSDDPLATGSGAFVHRRAAEDVNPLSRDPEARAELLASLEAITGLALPQP